MLKAHTNAVLSVSRINGDIKLEAITYYLVDCFRKDASRMHYGHMLITSLVHVSSK